MQPIAPCKDCQKRESGCHDRCEAYQEFRKTRREYNQKAYEYGIYNTYVSDRKAKIHDTMEKKKKR